MTDDDKIKPEDPSSARAKMRRPALDRGIQSHIGRKLKAIYDSAASEPLPDRILELLAKLESDEKG